MADKKVKAKENTALEEKNNKGLSYAQLLEARAQRGSMTHQKKMAVDKAKKKEMEKKG